MPTIKSLIVYDDGDSSVGNQGGFWEINFRGGIKVDDDQLEKFRRDVSKLYVWDNGNKGRVEFDFETEKRLAGERAEDKMLDETSDTGDEMQAQKHNWESDPDFCGCAECERLGKVVDSIFAE